MLAGRSGIEQIVLARSGRSAARRARPRRNPAAAVFPVRSRPRQSAPGEHAPLLDNLPLPLSLTGVASVRHCADGCRRAPSPCARSCPGLGRPKGRPAREGARPRAQPGPATRPDASGCPPACSPAWPFWRPACMGIVFPFQKIKQIE